MSNDIDVARLEGILDAATKELNDWRAPTESHGLPLTIPGRIAALASELVANRDESELVGALNALADKWNAEKYTGDYTQAVYQICAKQLRATLATYAGKRTR